MNRLPAYVRALSNDDLIWNRLKERGHRFRRSLGVSVFGCFEFAVLVNRLRTADRSEVARCLRLIESLATALRQTDDGDCVKCLVKLWLFAARIAGEGFQRDHIAISSWRKAWCHPVPSCGASPTSARRWTGTSSALVQKGEYLPDDSRLPFEVVCKGCRRTLVTVERLRDPVLAGQLRACSPSEPLGEAPMLGEVMRRVRVTALKV